MLAVLLLIPLPAGATNVILIILDDVGTDLINAYGEGDWNVTPAIDTLASNGVQFTNAYASPLCAISRASIMSGVYPYRHGVGAAEGGLPESYTTLAEALDGYVDKSYFVGKWHVTDWDPDNYPSDGYSPIEAGFDEVQGNNENFPGGNHHCNWTKWTQTSGSPSSVTETTFTVKDQVDKAITYLTATEPWFLVLSVHAIHQPSTTPDDDWHTRWAPGTYTECIEQSGDIVYEAMLEATDYQLNRLFTHGSMDFNDTVVFLVGDNGSLDMGQDRSYTGFKNGTTGNEDYREGGINVPLIVRGAGVTTTGAAAGLVSYVDIMPTILDMLGQTIPAGIDGVSFKSMLSDTSAAVRPFVYVDHKFVSATYQDPREHFAIIRNSQYKVIREDCAGDYGGTQATRAWYETAFQMYDLSGDPTEQTDLSDSVDPTVVRNRKELISTLKRATDLPTNCPMPTRLGGTF